MVCIKSLLESGFVICDDIRIILQIGIWLLSQVYTRLREDLEAQNQTSLAKLRADLEQEHATSLSDIKARHDEELSTLRAEYEQQEKTTTEQISELQQKIQQLESDREELLSQHKQEMDKMEEERNSERTSMERQLRFVFSDS